MSNKFAKRVSSKYVLLSARRKQSGPWKLTHQESSSTRSPPQVDIELDPEGTQEANASQEHARPAPMDACSTCASAEQVLHGQLRAMGCRGVFDCAIQLAACISADTHQVDDQAMVHDMRRCVGDAGNVLSPVGGHCLNTY